MSRALIADSIFVVRKLTYCCSDAFSPGRPCHSAEVKQYTNPWEKPTQKAFSRRKCQVASIDTNNLWCHRDSFPISNSSFMRNVLVASGCQFGTCATTRTSSNSVHQTNGLSIQMTGIVFADRVIRFGIFFLVRLEILRFQGNVFVGIKHVMPNNQPNNSIPFATFELIECAPYHTRLRLMSVECILWSWRDYCRLPQTAETGEKNSIYRCCGYHRIRLCHTCSLWLFAAKSQSGRWRDCIVNWLWLCIDTFELVAACGTS